MLVMRKSEDYFFDLKLEKGRFQADLPAITSRAETIDQIW